MEHITNDAIDFDQDSKSKATYLLKNLKNPRFLTMLIFLLDGSDRLAIFSKQMQEKMGIIIGKENDRKALLTAIENLKTKNGDQLTSFLKEVKCFKDLSWKQCQFKDLDDPNAKLDYKDVIVSFQQDTRQSHLQFKELGQLRIQFCESVIEQIRSYFPDSDLKMFDVLDPTKIPIDKCEVMDYDGTDDIVHLATFLGN